MTKTNFMKVAACTLAVTLFSMAAQSADAVTRHHHPQRLKAHDKQLAKAQPSQIPAWSIDLTRGSIASQYAMTQIKAQAAQTRTTGMGVTVAVLDGGFDLTHEALAGHIVSTDVDMVDFDGDSQDLGDGIDNDGDGYTDWIVGHGTFVSSLVLAVAPDAQILPIRVLDDEGWGTEQSVADGVNYAVTHGCKVIELSLVIPDAANVVKAAVRNALDAGVTVCGAAGNDPQVWYMDPVLANRILCTGGVNSLDTLLPWSVTGAPVDVYAPAENLVGALGGNAHPQCYAYWSGTSFASPLTAGGAALLQSAHPTWTPQMIVDRIKSTADSALGVLPPWGHGRINLDRATQ